MTVNYRTFVVANPAAGAGTVKEEWQLIERLLRANLPELDYAFTEGPGHASLLTREALRAGWEMVVAVGGDGTLNEVINGFFEPAEPQELFERQSDGWITTTDAEPQPISDDGVLGILPLGTGGDFRRTLGLMGGIAENVEHLRGRHTRTVDVGQLGYIDHQDELASRFFINISAAGMSGLVDSLVNSSWKGLGGTASFFLGTFRGFLKWRNVDIVVRLNDTEELRGPVVDVITANGEYFGGGMWIAPGAEVDNGVFQVVVLGDLSKTEQVKILPKIYGGKHLASPKVSRHRASQVAVRAVDADDTVLLDVDGEQPGRIPVTWVLRPQAVRVKI